MKLEQIPGDTKVTSIGMPRYYQGSNDKAVLLLHGFTGVANEMQYLAERLNEAGFTVAVPRLPGHGTTGKDFMLTNRRDWMRRAVDAYLELQSKYEKVYVVGLSMGGLLTLLLAAQFPVKRIALAAPALLINNKLIYLSPILRFFLRKHYVGHEEKSEDPEYQYLSDEYWSYRYGNQVYHLFRLQLAARRALSKVQVPALTLVSHNDHTVPVRVAELIEQRIASPNTKRVELSTNSHIIVNDSEKERAADEIVAWFSAE